MLIIGLLWNYVSCVKGYFVEQAFSINEDIHYHYTKYSLLGQAYERKLTMKGDSMMTNSKSILGTAILSVLFSFLFCLCNASAEVPAADLVPACDYIAEDSFMQIAIEEARTGIFNGHGGPFGSVIVKDGVIVGQGHNMVLANNDSTCHGEVSAIRNAEQNLGTYDLSGCILYTTGEPCPMCLAACMWANIKLVYYGCTIEDNALIGFRDEAFDQMFGGREAFADYLIELDREACLMLFEEYVGLNATIY